jgi:diguanylate cyclase (GGDEF)-like protein
MTPLPALDPGLSVLFQQYASLSENGIAALDAENRFIYYNASIAKMFGFSEQSMLHKTHHDLMVQVYTNRRDSSTDWPCLQDWLDFVTKRFRSAPFRRFEVDLKGGRWILMTEQICPGGELVMFCSDITQQKEAELALQKAHDEIERLALTDDLTCLPNRRNFMQQLAQEISRSQRSAHPFCLAMLDLDYFKKVNDQFGHAAGDVVLKHFADFMRQHLRAEDLIGRLGGEEFAVLLPEIDASNALLVLNRVMVLLRQERLPQIAPDFSYRFSCGLVQFGAIPAQHGNDLLALADQALYQAKQLGRDRVEVSPARHR